MKVFHYHQESRIYLGESVADLSPLEPGMWLVPASATEVPPPVPADGEVAVFQGDWSLFPDQRGVYYQTVEPLGAPVEWADPVNPPSDCTKIPPPTVKEGQQLSWTGEQWAVIDAPPEPTFKEKLSRLGITIEDLKAELGIV